MRGKITFFRKENDQCPYCKKGILKLRTGKYGSFLGCDLYPRCAGIAKIKVEETESERLEKEADRILENNK